MYLDMRTILRGSEIEDILWKMVDDIIQRINDTSRLCLIGIQRGGVHIARRMASKIKERTGIEIPVGILDISLYRDDISIRKEHPVLRKTEIPVEINEKRIILVDDVLFTGRSIRAALDAIMDFGRPQSIHLAVLIDRGHRELPICADFTGREVLTSKDERVEVRLLEDGFEDEVVII